MGLCGAWGLPRCCCCSTQMACWWLKACLTHSSSHTSGHGRCGWSNRGTEKGFSVIASSTRQLVGEKLQKDWLGLAWGNNEGAHVCY